MRSQTVLGTRRTGNFKMTVFKQEPKCSSKADCHLHVHWCKTKCPWNTVWDYHGAHWSGATSWKTTTIQVKYYNFRPTIDHHVHLTIVVILTVTWLRDKCFDECCPGHMTIKVLFPPIVCSFEGQHQKCTSRVAKQVLPILWQLKTALSSGWDCPTWTVLFVFYNRIPLMFHKLISLFGWCLQPKPTAWCQYPY